MGFTMTDFVKQIRLCIFAALALIGFLSFFPVFKIWAAAPPAKVQEKPEAVSMWKFPFPIRRCTSELIRMERRPPRILISLRTAKKVRVKGKLS